MARRAKGDGEWNGSGCQAAGSLSPLPNGLPAGLAWDADAKGPAAIVPYVEPDASGGERCPCCRRSYEGEPAATPPPSWAGLSALLLVLVDAAEHQKIARDLQLGRWLYLVARSLGILPGCATDAALARYLKLHPRALSESKQRLPLQFQALCHLRHRRRKPH